MPVGAIVWSVSADDPCTLIMKTIVGSCKYWPKLVVVILCFVSDSAQRNLPEDFDLEAAAAEPRPIFIETGPSAEALPLVYSVDSTHTPLTDASEKVEKVLKPALSFTYNPKDDEADKATAESKQPEQPPGAEEFYKYIEEENKKYESEVKKEVGKDDIKEEVKAEESKEEPKEELKGDLEVGEQVAETKHHEEKKHHEGGGGGKFEKGGGKDFHAHHHGEHGEKGDKSYKAHHHHERGHKGHHDKENHKKHYDEKGGHKKDHHHDDGYHGEHFKKHGGKKAAKFKEEGEHSKGHSTKGSHSIHKKDEYEKKTEFFEEDHEGNDQEKHGGYSHSEEFKKGGHHKGGHNKGGDHDDHYGKKGQSAKGAHFKEEQGHHKKGGHEHHHAHDSKHGHKNGGSVGKKWAFKESSDSGNDGHGNGHGHGGAHSHQSIAVQAPPNKEQVQESQHQQAYAVQEPPQRPTNSHQAYSVQDLPKADSVAIIAPPFQTYEIDPISPVILPLEDENAQQGNKKVQEPVTLSSKQLENQLLTEIYPKKKPKKTKKPTPTEEFLADYPYSLENKKAEPASSPSAPSVSSQMEQLIQRELNVNNGAENGQAAPKMTKRRRLKRRKIQRDLNHGASSTAPKRVHHDCALGHKKEHVVPEESSHSFVIVAADDAVTA